LENLNNSQSISVQTELAFVETLSFLWKSRRWIVLCTACALIVGFFYVLFATRIYHSEAIIAPKESQKSGGSAAILSQFGGLGGMVATQLGMGNTNLDRIEVIVRGREIAGTVVNECQLMPELFRNEWDNKNKSWKSKDSTKVPKIRDGIETLRRTYLKISVNKKSNTLLIGIDSDDPKLSEKIVTGYVNALNAKVRRDIIDDAQKNKEYLEVNRQNTLDPIIQDKIQSMIASEIERMMLVNSQSFDILEKPVCSIVPERPRKARILILSMVGGFIFGISSLYGLQLWQNIRKRNF